MWGQILFALYAAVAVTAASLSKSHLANTKSNTGTAQGNASWRSWALLGCLAPWAVFLLWTAVPQMLRSAAQLESFSEGLTPGYFVVRAALVLLAVLVLYETSDSAFSSLRRRQDIDRS